MQFQRIGVIGAGTMGADVATDLAASGYNVLLKDLHPAALRDAEQKIRNGFRGFQMIKPALRDMEVGHILERIVFTDSYDGFEDVELVIENIPEDWELKKLVYGELAAKCLERTYYAVNTSCISITKIAALMPRPDRVIGMHFMNPVPLKNIVEAVKGMHTSEETIAVAKAFLKTLKKNMILATDYPGFIANRLSHLFMNEAAYLVQDQVASPRDVDMLFRQGYGHQMGPLETADLIGLDTVVSSLRILYESYEDPKYRCCPLLKKMVDAGYHGRKSGKGFYDYN